MRLYGWHIFFMLFFAAMAIAALMYLETRVFLPTWIPLFDLVLIILATFRLTRLFVYDSITAFFRACFAGHSEGSFAHTLHTLVTCPWCMGLWLAFVVTFFYFLTPYAWFFILFLAVAGVASFVQILTNLVGWNAEKAKNETIGGGGKKGTCG